MWEEMMRDPCEKMAKNMQNPCKTLGVRFGMLSSYGVLLDVMGLKLGVPLPGQVVWST